MTSIFRKIIVALAPVLLLTGCVRFQCDPHTGVVTYERLGGSAKAQEVEFEFSNQVWKVRLTGYSQQNPELQQALDIADQAISQAKKVQ